MLMTASPEDFTKDFVEWRPAVETENVNILLFGQQGAGKTAFINTLCTALSRDMYRLASEGGTGKHSTVGEKAKQ